MEDVLLIYFGQIVSFCTIIYSNTNSIHLFCDSGWRQAALGSPSRLRASDEQRGRDAASADFERDRVARLFRHGGAQRQEKTALRLKVVFKVNLHRSLESQVQAMVEDDTSKTETLELACSACTSVTQNTLYFPQVLLQSCSSSDLTKKDEVLIKNTKRLLKCSDVTSTFQCLS